MKAAFNTEKPPWLMVTCGGCNRMLYAASTRPGVIDASDRRKISRMVADGCNAQHVAVEVVRTHPDGCTCKDQPQAEREVGL